MCQVHQAVCPGEVNEDLRKHHTFRDVEREQSIWNAKERMRLKR